MQRSETIEERLIIPTEVRRGARRRRWIIIVVILAIVAGLVVFLAVSRRAPPLVYRTTPVERRTVVQVVEASGHTDVVRRVELPAPGPGRLVELFVHEGDRVKQGQPLARLDQQSAEIALRSARAGLAAASSRISEASAALEAAVDARERTERLLERELASAGDLVSARSEEEKARAALSAARAEHQGAAQSVKSAELGASQTTIVSPLDGIVLKAPDALGGAVTPEQGALFVIGSGLETLRIDAEVGESDIAEVRPGKLARFTVPAFPAKSFQGRVERTGVDAQRSGLAVRYPVELSVDNREGLLLPGMTTTVRIEIARAEDTLAVREAALRFQPEDAPPAPSRSRVWKVNALRLEAIPVVPGLSDGAYTEIRAEPPEALSAGMLLAVGIDGPEQTDKKSSPGIRLGKR